MIKIEKLSDEDKGRKVVYRGKEEGEITSWNEKYVFVKFRGPGGEACNPNDLLFVYEWKRDLTNEPH
jgi:hypothetical protein